MEGLPKVEPSGFSIDQKGNFKAQVNVALKVVALNSEDYWEDARRIYMSFALKGKMFVMNPHHDNRTLVVLAKSLDLANLKIYRGEDEQFLEQMLVQSLVGAQLEQVKKKFKPKPIPLKNF